MIDFNELTERTSLGGYALERRLEEDDTGTFFAAVSIDGERVLLKAVSEERPGAGRQYATWERARQLRHANLLAIRDVGRSDGWNYAAFEYPDDAVASALEHGPLSEDETRGVLQAALAALRYLHAQGMVHGAVAPRCIVASGDTVKLTTDGVREPQDLDECAEDVRQLGELVTALRAPEPLSDPLATIARRATAEDRRDRWTLAEIAQALEPTPAEPVIVREIARETPREVPLEVPPQIPRQIARQPIIAGSAPPVIRPEEAESPSGGVPKWIYAGVAVLLLLILFFNLRRHTEEPRRAAIPQQPPVVAQSPAVSQAPGVTAASAPSRVEPAPVESGPWRVIAFTFKSLETAAAKAKHINERWPSLHAGVFAPRELHGYYLVALGDRMSRDQAAQLQRKARRMGLPRDTFIQNYRE